MESTTSRKTACISCRNPDTRRTEDDEKRSMRVRRERAPLWEVEGRENGHEWMKVRRRGRRRGWWEGENKGRLIRRGQHHSRCEWDWEQLGHEEEIMEMCELMQELVSATCFLSTHFFFFFHPFPPHLTPFPLRLAFIPLSPVIIPSLRCWCRHAMNESKPVLCVAHQFWSSAANRALPHSRILPSWTAAMEPSAVSPIVSRAVNTHVAVMAHWAEIH